MGWKVHLNHLLCLLGIRKILPRSIINAVKALENSEPLVNICEIHKIFFAEELPQERRKLRHAVAKKLQTAASYLPEGIFFKIYDAYRPLAVQKQSWDREYQLTKIKNPGSSEAELHRITSLKVASPYNGYSGHQTGAAIDVTLQTNSGIELAMGTKIAEYNEKTFTANSYLTATEKQNRIILKRALEKAGFNNYPGEWWHFSYGDQMWAAYKRKKQCCYGMIDV